MILATGSRELRSFTLLELLITLAIIALFSGVFLLRFDDGATEEALAEVATDLKVAALKGKNRSYAFRRNQYVVFSRNGFVLTERMPIGEGAELSRNEEASQDGRVESFHFPSGVTMELLPPGEKEWTRDLAYVWTFRSSGLSDPLSVRFSLGASHTRLTFNVLSGLAEEETILE